MSGMLLHIDGSTHRWLGSEQYHDLLVILDDATSEMYYAQLVEQESTRRCWRRYVKRCNAAFSALCIAIAGVTSGRRRKKESWWTAKV